MDLLTLETPGKLNLFLEIKGKRADSYHELLTLFYPVASMKDRISIQSNNSGKVQIYCNEPEVPLDSSNLVFKAVQIFFSAQNLPPPGLDIRIEKNLPVSGGMGGGSSDAGAVLRMLQAHSGTPLAETELRKAALSIGADVPFFLNPIAAIGRGRGEQLTPVELPENLPLLILPGAFPISAGWAYRHWHDAVQFRNGSLELLLKKLPLHDFKAAADGMRNDLEPAILQKFPLLALLCDLLRDSGGTPMISGSGPTVFALYPDFKLRDQAYFQLQTELAEYRIQPYKS